MCPYIFFLKHPVTYEGTAHPGAYVANSSQLSGICMVSTLTPCVRGVMASIFLHDGVPHNEVENTW